METLFLLQVLQRLCVILRGVALLAATAASHGLHFLMLGRLQVLEADVRVLRAEEASRRPENLAFIAPTFVRRRRACLGKAAEATPPSAAHGQGLHREALEIVFVWREVLCFLLGAATPARPLYVLE